MENDYGKITMNIEKLMNEQGINKYRLSEQAGMQRTQLNRFIKGESQRIDFHTMAKLCRVLKCDPGELFSYTEPEKE